MKIVGYIRVSTARQGQSGLGLEAQAQAIRAYARDHGGEVIEIIEEVESGANDARPALARALKLCRKVKARLVLAKLDRVSRDVHFISGLVKSGVDFAAADMPFADKTMIYVRAVFAEHERDMISARTKAALAAAKARGAALGGWRGVRPDAAACRSGQRASVKARLANSTDALAEIEAHVIALRDQGLSFNAMAKALTAAGVATLTGKVTWQHGQVKAVLARIG